MKRSAARIIVVIAAIIFSVSSVYAAPCAPCGSCASTCKTEELVGGMGKKFVRGVTNVFTGWVEIPVQISKGYKKACFGGAGVGVVTGIWHFVGRTMSGFGDMAGFWAADPASNENIGIPLDAPYACEEGTHYSLTNPNFGVATMTPMGNKLARGLGNTCFGFLEVPGQLVKGMRAHACDWGVGKALWYWFSREMDGVYDVATCLFPNPKDTMGLKFDERWPWTAIGLGDRN
jgi:putative exosortase-associated protein (TIGR04073 family)